MSRHCDRAPDHPGFLLRELVAAPTQPDLAHLAHLDHATGSYWCSSWGAGIPAPTGRWPGACECGWRGDIIEADEIATIDPDHSPTSEFLDETVEDLLLAGWKTHIADTSALVQLTTAAEAFDAANHALDDAVRRARTAGHSWTQIGQRFNITRQGAQQRWSHVTQ